MIKILITNRLNTKVIDHLKEIPEFDVVEKYNLSREDLKQEITDYDAVVVRTSTRLDREILDQTTNLKIIVRAGIGLENIDVKFAESQNIEVRNTPFATSITVAEYTLALLLGICRFVGPSYKNMKEHNFAKHDFTNGTELFEKTAGIIGFGRIGKEVAKREIAMGMHVVFHDIIEIKTDVNAKQVPLEELLKQSDYISIHLPLNDSTRNFISYKEFELMKKSAVLVNVSKGGIVDEDALLDALNKKTIKAVAMDVFEKEPPENFELIDHEKVYPAPFLGSSTVEGQKRAGRDVISILTEFFNV